MSVFGLPKTIDGILTTLLSSHNITSWRVSDEDQNPVVVLRFGPTQQQQDGETQVNSGAWRKKAPSQIRRDQQRAQQKRNKNVQQTYSTRRKDDVHVKKPNDEEETRKASEITLNSVSSSPSGLFLPSPEMTRNDRRSTHSFANSPTLLQAREPRSPVNVPAAEPEHLDTSFDINNDCEQDDVDQCVTHRSTEHAGSRYGSHEHIGPHDNSPPMEDVTLDHVYEQMKAMIDKLDSCHRDMCVDEGRRGATKAKERQDTDTDTRSGTGIRNRDLY